MREQDFRKYSNLIQKEYYELLEKKEFDLLCSSELKYLHRILRSFIPSKKTAEKLYNKIACSGNLYYRVLLVNCLLNDETISVPVICVKQSENQIVFYDTECRKYRDWEDFLSNHRLPKCLMRFPKNGLYEMENGILKLEEKISCSVLSDAHEVMRGVTKVGAILASFAADVDELKPYNKAIAWVSGICNGYSVGHHLYQINDRAMHDQSIHYSDSEGASHWIHITEDIALFSVTMGKMKFGSPQSQVTVMKNLLSLVQDHRSDGIESLEKIQTIILGQHLSYFSNQAIEFIQNHITGSSIDLKELIFNVKRHLLVDNSIGGKFRRFVEADGATVSTVAKGMAFSKEIPKLFHGELNAINLELNEIVESIMQEMKKWANGNATLMQLNFRIYGICSGSKIFETIEEMCKHFNVGKPEDILENNKCLFSGSRGEFLNFFKETCNPNRPQLLYYIVEYLREVGNDDIENFKNYFQKRMCEEFLMHSSFQGFPLMHADSKQEWVNADSLENLNYTCSVHHEGTILVRPQMGNFSEITYDDLFKLAKRLLGRVGSVEMKMARPDVNWVVVASKKTNSAVIIGPKMSLKLECYPVFKRLF